MNTTHTLTTDQQKALDSIHQFLLDPIETVFILKGYSGCGKTTLIKHLLDGLDNFIAATKLICPDMVNYDIKLTATTNKAAENLYQITKREATTIHSLLGLRVQIDYKTNITNLISSNKDPIVNTIVFIDEASQIDSQLLQHIFSKLQNCKIIFIGDPAQLIAVKAKHAVVFEAKFPSANLTEVVRQAEGNPIVDLSTKFRNTVNSGEFFNFQPDGHHIKHVDRETFNDLIIKEFTRPEWTYNDSKVLAWTNKCVINYNNAIREVVTGNPHFNEGDYAICNSFVTIGNHKIKTDELVHITAISKDTFMYGVPGNEFTIDGSIHVFMPKTLEARNKCIKQARTENKLYIVADIEKSWIDLRAAYAQTINKSQGSTYNQVFIDLNDVGRCNSGDQIARMLYVGVSRAKEYVTFTGDFI